MVEVNLFSKLQVLIFRIGLYFSLFISIISFIFFMVFDYMEENTICKIFAILFLIFLTIFAIFCLGHVVLIVNQKNKIISNMDVYLSKNNYEGALNYLDMFKKRKIFKINYQFVMFYYGFIFLKMDDIEKSKDIFNKLSLTNVNFYNAQIAASYYFLDIMISVYKNENCDLKIKEFNVHRSEILRYIRGKKNIDDLFGIIDDYQLNKTIDTSKLKKCFYSDIKMIKRMCFSN